jgi:hypothetical protein
MDLLQLYQAYQEGKEGQFSAPGLIVNAIIVRNTGHDIPNADIQRLSPLGYEHINIMGRYSFNTSKEFENGSLRPLMNLDDEVD